MGIVWLSGEGGIMESGILEKYQCVKCPFFNKMVLSEYCYTCPDFIEYIDNGVRCKRCHL